jgi:MerR family transcriptional regulator, copper efflux regulator
MRITEAAGRLGTSPRMLRYREELGLLPQLRDRFAVGRRARPEALTGRPGTSAGRPRAGGPSHRQFSDADIAAVAAELDIEKRYDISPAALAFGLRVLAEPSVRASVADLARRLGRVAPTPSRALDFEKERALRSISRG